MWIQIDLIVCVSCVIFGCVLSSKSSVYIVDLMYKWRLAPWLGLHIDVPNNSNQLEI